MFKNFLRIFVVVLLIGAISLTAGCKKSTGTNKTTDNGAIGDISSVVSKGANLDDLGNIINGQYFFDDGVNQYYSSFDSNSAAHIYKTVKSTGTTSTIFDGFGWSLVVYGDWLYFSGNEGVKIDSTYNLFRLKTDGSKLEKINTGYCYGMSFYKEYLYYIKKDSVSSTTLTINRSALDGTNEKVIANDGLSCCVVYENRLYYMNNANTLYSAAPDGTDKKAVLDAKISIFIIGNGHLVYLDTSQNIYIADIDGSNSKLVKKVASRTIYVINSYKDKIFYVEYDTTAITERYAYQYYLYSINFDGTQDKKIYEGVSYGFYINMLNDKVFVLDYAIDVASGKMPAIARNMNLDGSGVKDLFR